MTSACLSCTGEAPKDGGFVFRYSYSNKSDHPAIAYYEDGYFDLPSTQYQGKLATSSCCLALAGFGANREKAGSYANRFINGKEFLESAGFSDVTPNADYKAKPTTDSFGVLIGKKKLAEKTLLAVAVRGGNYEQEWASNCTLGMESEGLLAKGFRQASDIYLSSLKQYIQENNITGPIKLWTAGFSRGGAAVNLSVGRLDEELLQGKHDLLPGVSYAKEDLYAYCFEPPAGGSFDADALSYDIKGEGFSNIHCIVNPNDPVPMVAPKQWNFARYGNEYYLSDPLTDIDSASHLARVKSFYGKMDNAQALGSYIIDSFSKRAVGGGNGFLGEDKNHLHWTQGLYLSDLVGHLSKALISRDEFSANIEPSIRDIFAMIYNKNTPKDSLIDIAIGVARSVLTMDTDEVLFADLMHAPNRFYGDLKPLLRQALKDAKVELDIDLFLTLVGKVVSAVIQIVSSDGGLDAVASLFAKDNVKRLAQGHRPELCLAHMMAMDPRYGGTQEKKLTQSYYVLRADTNVDFLVKRNGQTLASFAGGKAIPVNSSIAYGINYRQEVVYLPPNQEYEIQFGDTGDKVVLFRQASNAAAEVQVQ